MTVTTKRDVLWDATLQVARSNGRFATSDVQERFKAIKPRSKKVPTHDTTRDCLDTLHQMGYIKRIKNSRDEWKISLQLLDPLVVFQVFTAILSLSRDTNFVDTQSIMDEIGKSSEPIIRCSLEILQQEGFVERQTEEEVRNMWYINI